MDDEDDDAQGLSPTSIWRKNRKRKDYSDEEDEEEEQDHKYKGRLRPDPIPIASVRVAPPPAPGKLTARMSTGGKVPRHCLASKNHVANLNRRECMHVPQKDLPGEWDHKLPKKESKGSTPEWEPCSIGQRLWGDLDQATQDFQQAYGLLMGIIRDLQIHYELAKPKKEEDK
jgi:hypothetical protein